jgi:hypothetical protein
VSSEYAGCTAGRDTQPWIEFEVLDNNKFGEMLLFGIREVNQRLAEA